MTSAATSPAGLPDPPDPALRLVARTVALPDPGPLLDLLPADDPFCWLRREEGLVGWGEAVRIDTSGPSRFADAEAAWHELVAHALIRDDVGLPGTGPVAFGSFAFAADSPAGGALVVPEVLVGQRGGVSWLTTVGVGPVLPSGALPAAPAPPAAPGRVEFSPARAPRPAGRTRSPRCCVQITGGSVDKVVLARDLHARAEREIDPRWPLRRLAERYPGCWTFSVDGLLGATPEMLVRLDQGLVTSRVLAGTIRRSGDDDRDLRLAASLARSSKDLEEHEYAVRSVAEALAPHCSSTNVPESPFVLHLANVMHLATDVTGVLADRTSSLALAAALHPSAAVCGTPTAAAADLIAKLEQMDRGRYAGPVGWMDARGDGEWGIALRCAARDPDPRRLRLFAGCGIVAGSDPEAELAEADAKFVPVMDALSS